MGFSESATDWSQKHLLTQRTTASSVFERLHAASKRNDNFKPQDSRTSEQKILEEHCTFAPKLICASPFMSQRDLRVSKRFGHHIDDSFHADSMDQMFSSHTSSRSQSGTYKQSERSARAHASPKTGFSPFYYFRGDAGNEPSYYEGSGDYDGGFEYEQSGGNGSNGSGPPVTLDAAAYPGGLFITGFGLIKGPPASAGIPMFYFNPLFPPSFELGSYLTNVSVESQPISDFTDESSGDETARPIGMEAPPLPQWAFVAGGDPERAKGPVKGPAPAIVIVKKAPQEKPATGATGYA
jgi:hypothetical protein